MDTWASILSYGNLNPSVPDSVFLAPGVFVIGAVTIGERSSVWYNSTVRGDVNTITIGSDTNVQDNSVLHVTHDTHPLVIGDRVTCGHAVRLHGCTVHDEVLIGIGAIILDGAVIGSRSIVAAGALVPPDFRVPEGALVAGVPAKVVRDLRPEEVDNLAASAARYVAYSAATRESLRSQLPLR